MCDDGLNEELDRGTELCRELVEHLLAMGGATVMRQAVEVDGRFYEATVSTEGNYPRRKDKDSE